METQLMTVLDDIANREGVQGVLIADEKGLCLGTRGVAKSETAAFAASIARTARELLPPGTTELNDRTDYPTINIDYKNHKVVIRNEGSFTLAIFM
ncbi:hypothetical protein O0I10_008859 [Lichtheimia ornata]|nr:uncharacterized protein O0I10_008859 [Lichtheimia ornata]KAJ8655367.1 hypothetical protein O0I10_008859 [Lichtheimia ornata]